MQKPGEEVRGFTVDNVRKTYWVYTDSSLFELVVANEDRDIWRVYLEKGMPDVALQYTKVCFKAAVLVVCSYLMDETDTDPTGSRSC